MFDQEPAVSPAPLSTLFTYTYHSQRLRWGDARRSCQSMGLELATITSDQDHMAAVAASTATGANLQSEQAWIGLSDAVSEGWWHWSDGSSSAYRRWHSGEPNGGTGENCAMMSSVDWYDVGCNQQKPYLCAFSSSWPPFAPRPISPPPSAPAAHSYTFINGWVDYSTAAAGCTNNGQYLATISSSAEEQAAVSAVSLGSGDMNSGVWIGYTDAVSEGTWLWTDGWSSDYTHWVPNEWGGGAWGGDEEDCASMYSDGWRGKRCNEWMGGYLCSVPNVPMPPSSPAPPPNLHTYTYISSYVTWAEARSACEANGLQLATISMASEEQAAVDAITTGGGNVNDQVWIGLTDASSEGLWSWSDGSAWSYRHWKSGEPNGGHSENCATVKGNSGWHDVSCFERWVHGYLCSESSVSHPPAPFLSPPLPPCSPETDSRIGDSALSPEDICGGDAQQKSALLVVALSSIALNIALSVALVVVCRKAKQRAQPLPALTTIPMLTTVPPMMASSTATASTPGGGIDLGVRPGGQLHDDAIGMHERM